MNNFIGRWAVCGAGFLGRVERFDSTGVDGRGVYYGVKTNGEPWQSLDPTPLHPDVNDQLDQAFDHLILPEVDSAPAGFGPVGNVGA